MPESLSASEVSAFAVPAEGRVAADGPAVDACPLCVDLDGTLVKSDTLVDSLLVLARKRPADVLKVPGWVARGKAGLKAAVAERVTLDVTHMPYNQAVLGFLKQQHGAGRKIYLATGADSSTAVRVAEHLGIFDGVLASDGKTNLTGANKLDSFTKHFGETGFDYIGNAKPDVKLLVAARKGMIANPDGALKAAAKAGKFKVAQRFDDQASTATVLRRALRVHQWAKNVLIFVPLLLAHALGTANWVRALVAFGCISLCASATYIFNDLLDIEADRRHPKKKRRPFASGDLSGKAGVMISGAFLLVSLGVSAVLGWGFLGYMLLYLVGTVSYSFYLKRIVLVDVLILSGLYTVRLLAGADAGQVVISPWLAGFSIFLFLSLAMVKRFNEMQNLHAAGKTPTNGRGYLTSDIEQLRAFGTSAAYAAVVVFSFYISSQQVELLYRHPSRLWLVTPLLIFWVSRVWMLASRGELDEDPVIFAITDPPSLGLGVAVAAIAVAALF